MTDNPLSPEEYRDRFWDDLDSDPQKEEQGVWCDWIPPGRFLIRSSNAIAAQTAARKILGPERAAADQDGTLPAEQDRLFTSEWAGTALILDWENVPDPDSVEMLPFSRDEAVRLCRRSNRLAQWVVGRAKLASIYRRDRDQDTAKNS